MIWIRKYRTTASTKPVAAAANSPSLKRKYIGAAKHAQTTVRDAILVIQVQLSDSQQRHRAIERVVTLHLYDQYHVADRSLCMLRSTDVFPYGPRRDTGHTGAA